MAAAKAGADCCAQASSCLEFSGPRIEVVDEFLAALLFARDAVSLQRRCVTGSDQAVNLVAQLAPLHSTVR